MGMSKKESAELLDKRGQLLECLAESFAKARSFAEFKNIPRAKDHAKHSLVIINMIAEIDSELRS